MAAPSSRPASLDATLGAAVGCVHEPAGRAASPRPAPPAQRGTVTGAAPATRNFTWLAVDKALAVVLGLAVFGMIARHYGPVGTGHYAFALTLLQTALGLSLVCSSAAILPRLSRMRRGMAGALANVFVVRLAGSVVAALVVAGYALVAIEDPARLQVSLLVLAAVPLIEPFFVATMYWQSRNDNRLPVLNRAAGLVSRAVVVGGAVALGAPLWVPALGWLLEAVIVALLQVRISRHLAAWRTFATRITRWRSTRYFQFGVRFLLGIALGQLFLRGDRLVLAQLLPAYEFGVYATAMQLVDVWHQVGQIIGVAIGPAFLYAALRADPRLRAHWRTIAGLAAIGLLGLGLASALGRPALELIFGRAFGPSQPYLVAGTLFAVLAFVDVFVTIRIAVRRQPFALAVKWGTSVVVAIATQLALFGDLRAFAGPAGLAVGLVSGWLALGVLHATSGWRAVTDEGRQS